MYVPSYNDRHSFKKTSLCHIIDKCCFGHISPLYTQHKTKTYQHIRQHLLSVSSLLMQWNISTAFAFCLGTITHVQRALKLSIYAYNHHGQKYITQQHSVRTKHHSADYNITIMAIAFPSQSIRSALQLSWCIFGRLQCVL